MITRNCSAAVIAVLLAGCGGGGGSGDTAVSATPPPADQVAETPTPAPAPGLVTPPPKAPGPTPAPPGTTPPAAQPEPAPAPAVSGEWFVAGFAYETLPKLAPQPPAISRAPGSAGPMIQQVQAIGAFEPGRYAYVSSQYQDMTGWGLGDDPGVNPAIEYSALTIRLDAGLDAMGNLLLGNTLRINAGAEEMYLSGPAVTVKTSEAVPLDATVAEWRSGQWYVQLQAQSRGTSDSFGVCWHVQMPAMKRVACHLFPRARAGFEGNYIGDDSTAFGLQEWR